MDNIDKFFMEKWVDRTFEFFCNVSLFEEWCEENSISYSDVIYLELKYKELIKTGDEKIKATNEFVSNFFNSKDG